MAGGGTSYIELYANSLNSDNIYDSPYYQTLAAGEALPTPSEISMTNPPYVFTKWNTARDGSGTSYNPGDIINDESVLYAQWGYPAEEYNIISNHSLIDLATSIKKKTKQCPAPLLSINQMVSTIDNLDTSNISGLSFNIANDTEITKESPLELQVCEPDKPFSFFIIISGASTSSATYANSVWVYYYNVITNTLGQQGFATSSGTPAGRFDKTTGILTILQAVSGKVFYCKGSNSYGATPIRGWRIQ